MRTLLLVLKALAFRRPVSFLKCDAKGCVHVELHKTITKDMINEPCPNCGSNLLTAEDYQEHCLGFARSRLNAPRRTK